MFLLLLSICVFKNNKSLTGYKQPRMDRTRNQYYRKRFADWRGAAKCIICINDTKVMMRKHLHLDKAHSKTLDDTLEKKLIALETEMRMMESKPYYGYKCPYGLCGNKYSKRDHK